MMIIYMGYMNLSGRFHYRLASGHEYLLVGYNYGSNKILVETLKNIQAITITEELYNINKQFATAGVQLHTYGLDNEVFNTLKRAF